MTTSAATRPGKAGKPAKPKYWMPAFGLVVGGDFDGHRYFFHGFVAQACGLMVDATLYRPNWPFPLRMLLAPGQYKQLQSVPGERAKRIPADALIVAACAKHLTETTAAATAVASTTKQEEHAHVG